MAPLQSILGCEKRSYMQKKPQGDMAWNATLNLIFPDILPNWAVCFYNAQAETV